MVRRGQYCANCLNSITGRAVNANGKHYHPGHFTCYQCDIPLDRIESYLHVAPNTFGTQEEVYCHHDYHDLFTPRCHYCTTPVIVDGIQALDRIYHREHFFCAGCSAVFTGTYVEHEGLAWHEECLDDTAKDPCRKCGEPIRGDGIELGTTRFHERCFICAECKRSLKDGFYWSEKKTGICQSCKGIELKECI